MLVVFFRALILFAVVFIVIRLMGKRELSKVQPFELAIIVMISDIASGPMSDRGMQIFGGIIPIIALLVIYIFLTIIIRSHKKAESLLCGNPVVIINKGKVLEDVVTSQKITIEEIMAQLRAEEIYKIQDVAYAVLETNGKLNAQKISDVYGQMPLNVISDGQYLESNMKILNMTKEDVDNVVGSANVKMEDLLVGTIDEQGKFIFQKKEASK